MKRALFFFVFFFTLFSIMASTEVKLFDITSELQNYKIEEVTDNDERIYENMDFYLVTGGPGSLVWENFGHTAILVTSPSSIPIAYDWGIFSFDDSFFINFAFGRLYYEAWATRGEYRIFSLENDDRSVDILKLELSTKEKKNLYSFLQYSTRDENRTYLYDYFLDNCATRPRDIFSWATGGEFEKKLKATPNEETIRDTVERHLSLSSFPVAWTISYLLGPSVDKKSSVWDACFLPSRLEEEIEKYQGNSRTEYYSSENRKDVPLKWSMEIRALLFGIALFLLPFLSVSKKRWIGRTSDLLLGIINLFFGILSSVLIFFIFFTIHNVTKGNMNVFILSPLCLISSVLHFMSLGKKRKKSGIRIISLIMLLSSLITLALRICIPSLIQNSWSYFIPAILLYVSEIIFNT